VTKNFTKSFQNFENFYKNVFWHGKQFLKLFQNFTKTGPGPPFFGFFKKLLKNSFLCQKRFLKVLRILKTFVKTFNHRLAQVGV
jgi:hypothetical protein